MLKLNNLYVVSLLIGVMSLMGSCSGEEDNYYPKPRGILRLDFPDRQYEVFKDSCPYSFEIPNYFEVENTEFPCYKKLLMDRFNAELYVMYMPVDTNLVWLIERARSMTYEHSIVADGIEEALIKNETNQVYGMKYKLVGNAATNFQFYLTDSLHHFVRAELYFNAAPNYDSLRPSLEYVVEDLEHMIETFTWSPGNDI